MEFKKTIEWNKGHRLAKLKAKQDSKGNTYYMAEFGYNNVITARIRQDFNGENILDIQIFPIKYEKQNGNQQTQQTKKRLDDVNSLVKNEFDGEEVPF